MKLNAVTKTFLAAGLMSFVITGCGGDDGENGKDGVIGVDINSSPQVNAIFTSAKVNDGQVTVDFRLENANGVAVLGLNANHDLRFGIAQLTQMTETMDDKDGVPTEYDRGYQWQAYINVAKTPGAMPDDQTGLTPRDTTQADVEKVSNCVTCLVDHNDGSYTYTFQQNIANVTTPVAVAFNADFTQRATLELELPQTVANAAYDWQPSTGLTEGITSRDMVAMETCYTCHQPESLEFHGGRRTDLANCISCHTVDSADPESGNSIDFTYLIHAIHKGDSRMTFDAETETKVPAPYKIIGYKGSVHDYGKVMYPQQPAADCAACHVQGEDAPKDADLFLANMNNDACIACHTTTPKAYHKPDNENCISCHIEEGYARSGAEGHGDATKRYKASQDYSANFSKISVTNGVLTFDVQLLNEKGEAVAKEFIANPSKYTKSSIYFSWDTDKDYPAYTDSTKYSARGFALLNPDVSTYDATTKTFSIDSSKSALVLPASLEGKSVELFAGVATCFKSGGYGRPVVEPTACQYDETDADNPKLLTDAAYIQDAPLGFTWNNTDTSKPATARRDIIDNSKCMGCHNQEIVHYDNGINCQACHTPDKGLNKWGGNVPTSFAYKAHHAEGHYLKYAGVGSSTVVKTDCSTCHTDNGIELGRSPERAWRYGDADGSDIWVSSDAGACLSCHQKYLSDAGKAHITSFGGILDGIDAADAKERASESCATCHSPEQIRQLHK